MKSISVQDLKAKLDAGDDIQVIDVREAHEVQICSIKGYHIPMGEILERAGEIKKEIPVVIHCRSGARSAAVITALENNLSLTNLHNLTGGILAWATEIDTSLEAY
ncbi:MAG: rhodanese-like domain-containing protein [Flavobacteriales bacterium]|nr:rhodanese-like domain-containing protein [Flavobacteriales bacterium]MDG1780452.1 rhodanese-like domain-containing protein [Flavobacteriales bacterium]MDG2245114.1 rhodanese-like domain-containing protein [Flavobacteriales bacterium]